MLVEPLADVVVNVPGVIAILVAPVAAQLRVLLAPEFMVVGLAVKDVIVGAEPVPGGDLTEFVVAPQPVRPEQASGRSANAQRRSHSLEELRLSKPSLLMQKELGESMLNPSVAIGSPSLVNAFLR